MSTDMHVAPVESRAGVFLKTERFAVACRILGYTSDVSIGRAIGMTDRTISRVREGIIGEQFIAAVLSHFVEHADDLSQYGITVNFEEFFEIRDKAVSA